jgi:hypothetical protein
MQYLISAAVMFALLNGCRSAPPAATPSTPGAQNSVKSFKDYPDHAFNPRDYIRGMVKGGHNVLIWQDPSVDLRKYRSVNVVDFGGQLLPVQNVFSYDPFVSSFNATFQSSLKLSKENSSDALWVGYGAGKAGGAVVCEVYEPNKSRPFMRLYLRDTSSGGTYGGNSLSMLNHIFFTVANRLSSVLQARIGHS